MARRYCRRTGVTVVVTVKGTEYCGDPLAGVVTTVEEDVGVRTAPVPVNWMKGWGR